MNYSVTVVSSFLFLWKSPFKTCPKVFLFSVVATVFSSCCGAALSGFASAVLCVELSEIGCYLNRIFFLSCC